MMVKPALVLVALFGTGAFILVRERVRSRKFREALMRGDRTTPAAPPTKSWQDQVAETLRQSPNVGRPVDASERNGDLPTNAPEATTVLLTLKLLRELEWKRFELIVQQYYAATGVGAECTCNGADGGIDVKLYRPGETSPYSYVQCKAWGDNVGVAKVRELLGVMAADKIESGVFATTSDFWPNARTFAAANGILALGGEEFVARFNQLPEDTRRLILSDVTAGDYRTPSCPSCDIKMAPRERKRDRMKFWSCTRCRKILNGRGGESETPGA